MQRGRNLDEFVMIEYAEDVRDADIKKASAIISGLIQRAVFNLIAGEREAAVANERLARYIHKIYSQRTKGVKRNVIAPYAELKKGVIENNRRNLPPGMRMILEAEIQAEKAEQDAAAAGNNADAGSNNGAAAM
jgi:hypothetical protein